MRNIEFKADRKVKLKDFLLSKGISNRAYRKIIKDYILVNEKKVRNNVDLNFDDLVRIIIEDENLNYEPIDKNIKILYEDEDILAVEKPSNLTVNSKGQENLSNYLANYFKNNNIKSQVRLINRLDMNTSGIMLIAKNPYAQAYYQKLIENNEFNKEYLALVQGNLKIDEYIYLKIKYDEKNKIMKVSQEGNNIKTYFKTLKSYDDFSLIYCKIFTGKTHQIRISLANLNYPILGDKLYGSNYDMNRFLLHAFKVKFKRFRDGEKITILSRPDFDKYLNSNNLRYD
ncbi:RluA family pseudouridine synthase [Anaerococcus rubeinfantis]|uniref:RluA family pseudouridine synthase n=1 Tax=Anaerococcus rubeinfantis TaxID=1720199 RepID=UPI00073F7E39|nr:RluA family pseudouridine synthase [Anaerococcus rubeinfantis]